jgi:hypothetical protein
MKDNGTSQNYQKGNLKAMVHFAEHIRPATSFQDVNHKQVIRFLDTKIKTKQVVTLTRSGYNYLERLPLAFEAVL